MGDGTGEGRPRADLQRLDRFPRLTGVAFELSGAEREKGRGKVYQH